MRFVILLATLPSLGFSCANGFDTWLDGRCFRMNYHSSVFYTDSLNECNKDNSRLPAIKSQEENDQFFSALKQYNSFTSYSFWLSLSCDGEKFTWADGSEASYTNFAGDYNCTSSTAGRRYYIDNDRLWYESITGREDWTVNNVVCEGIARSASPCDSYGVLQSGKTTETCYKLQDDTMTWQSAENNCRGQGAHLSVIHDQTLNDFIRRSAVSAGFLDGIHIGIQKTNYGNYSWVDGTEIDYDNFVAGFPSDSYGDCVAMETGFLPGQWMNVDCYNTRLPYVCTKPAFYATNPQPAGCPVKTQYAPGDELYSPAYPQAPGVTGCDYLLLEPNTNKRAEVEISFFETNSCCDTLTVYDGLFGSNILKTLTGFYSNSITVRANSNAIRLHWNATSGSHVRGFSAKFTSS